jgi:uncharacterized protein YndB with AHSA1/START domain
MAKIPRIEQTYYYAAPPSRIFAALTEPSELAKWFVEKAVFPPREGAAFRLTWRGSYTMKGRVLVFDPPTKLHLEWADRFEGKQVFVTEARFTLKKKGKGTLLSLTHRGFKSGKKWIALYGSIQSGWTFYLTNLRSVLERGIDLRRKFDVLG